MKKIRYDFVAIRKIGKENGFTYLVHNHGQLRYNLFHNGKTYLIDNAKSVPEAHNSAVMRIRQTLIEKGVISETDYIL